MKIKRDHLMAVVRNLPEEVAVEELIYRLQLLEKLAVSEVAIAEGRTFSQEEVEKMAAEWLK